MKKQGQKIALIGPNGCGKSTLLYLLGLLDRPEEGKIFVQGNEVSSLEDEARTILMVTHELTEAIFVSDRVLGLSQYWDWEGAGHEKAPGATIVYDKAATIFAPDETNWRKRGTFLLVDLTLKFY